MAGHGGFVYGNIAATVTPVASTSAAGYGVTNATDGVPSTCWRSTGAAATETITWDFATPVTLTAAALCNHNIPVGATSTKVQFSSDNFAHVHAEFTFTWRATDMYVTFAAQTYRYVRIEVVLAGAAMVQIGEAYVGSKWQFAKDFNQEWQRIFRVNKDVSINSAGQAFQDDFSEQTGFRLAFRCVPQAAEWAYVQAVVRACYVVFVPDMTATECYHGVVTQNEVESTEWLNVAGTVYSAYRLTFWESPRVSS